jgi:hypothetical protein
LVISLSCDSRWRRRKWVCFCIFGGRFGASLLVVGGFVHAFSIALSFRNSLILEPQLNPEGIIADCRPSMTSCRTVIRPIAGAAVVCGSDRQPVSRAPRAAKIVAIAGFSSRMWKKD